MTTRAVPGDDVAVPAQDRPPEGSPIDPVAPPAPDGIRDRARHARLVRARLAATAVVAIVGMLVAMLAAPSAFAQSVPRLTAQVTDEAGALSAGRGDLDAALTRLRDAANVQLWVAFVHTTGSDTASDFAKATFEQNSLGGNDFLLVVAVDDHRYAWWENGAVGSMPSTTIDDDASRTLEPRFQAGDYAGGVADFADAVRTDLAKEAGKGDGNAGGGGAGDGSAGGSGSGAGISDAASRLVALALLALAIVALALVAIFAFRRWRTARLTEEERDRRTGELARRANAGLIAADDAVRESTQDLGFAEAQFDEPDVAPLRAAIASAKDELKAAFTVRQKLDDEIPEDPPTREAMLGEIVDRTGRAVATLDEQRRRIQGLREQEQKAPGILDEMPARIAALEQRLPGAEATLERLHAYAPTSVASVAGNAVEARKRLADSTAETERGRQALAATPPDAHAAGRSVRRVVGALAETTTLLDAIDRMAAAVDDARSRVDREIADASNDLQAARTAAGTTPSDASTKDHLAEAASLLDRARAAAGGPQPDVLAAVQAARQANASADRILAGIRETQAQLARDAAALQAALRAAETGVAQASDYITTRRTGVGREARTRLAEAERHLEAAKSLAPTDGPGAKAEADTATRMAAEAYQLARSDFDGWDGGSGRGGGSDLGKIILGGIILGNVLGGGRRGGGGWGGTPWGMPGGGGGWGGGGFGGGGFGGGRGGGGGWGGFGGGGGGGGRGGSGGW